MSWEEDRKEGVEELRKENSPLWGEYQILNMITMGFEDEPPQDLRSVSTNGGL